MDFIQTFNESYEKLANKSIVNILWKEILQEERTEDHLDELIEYSFHYPVDTDAYLERLLEKFDILHKQELRSIDGHLKAYIITFLYYCTMKDNSRVSVHTTLLASSLYIKLVSIPGVGKIFDEPNMLKGQLILLVKIAKERNIDVARKRYIVKLFKKYALKKKPDIAILQGIANTFVLAGLMVSTEVVNNFESVKGFTKYCLHCLRRLIEAEENDQNIKGLFESVFRCFRRSVIEPIPNKPAAISVIIAFVRDVLQNEMDVHKFQSVLDGFCLVWGREDFDHYEEAVVMMNFLKAEYYKELLRRMVLYTQSKNHKNYSINVFNLFYGMIKNFPNFPLDKVDVFSTCVFRNIIFHFVDSDKHMADRAINVVTNICELKDNPLVNHLLSPAQGISRFISTEVLLCSFVEVADQRWGASPRNQNLLMILSKVLPLSNVHEELVQQVLGVVCKDCTPHSLKPALPRLHELFCIMSLKQQIGVAEAVLRIIFKMAMHPDATSAEYCEHLFHCLLNPSVIDGITYSSRFYYNLLLNSDFEFEPLFIKCQRKIRPHHVKNTINQLDYNEPASALLLCCLLNYCKYEDITALLRFYIDNFAQISVRQIAGHLAVAFQQILTNHTLAEEDVPQLDVLQSLIMEALFEHNFPVNSIKPSYLLFQNIRNLLRIDTQHYTLDQLMFITSNRAFNRINNPQFGDPGSIMYLAELCLLLNKLPTENVLTILESFMNDSFKVEGKCCFAIHLLKLVFCGSRPSSWEKFLRGVI
ncbi:unnamed protein product [Acanthoscelides obtectus]|uniref:Uncharacterized protein n=2 Tax=Acanthoscelides obtectus TaxID=200917 RepID=A0A9P0KP82_ACAOB|nr:unnamed protein product [Acanthoscelides obtectus]CAK1628632.1 hypothetical protein AOBTE_LOCUS5315 [Acanthoscelides obtectus]